MAFSLMISGLLPYDSGKTEFALGLAKEMIDAGLRVTVFKPVAAHNLWLQYKAFLKSKDLGILTGEDVQRYVDAGLINHVEMQNPVDVLTAPPDIRKYREVSLYLMKLENIISQAVIARVSIGEEINLLIKENLNYLTAPLKSEVMRFLKIVKRYKTVTAEGLSSILTSNELGLHLLKIAEELKQNYDVVLIESFSNALVPSHSLINVIDGIITVTPTLALIYGRERTASYLRWLKTLSNSSIVTSAELVRLVRPDTYVEIHPSISEPPQLSLNIHEVIKALGYQPH